MELAKIEQLIAAYFEGETTLQEEKQLRAYFCQEHIAPQFKQYQPLFAGFAVANEECSKREFKLPQGSNTNTRWWLSIAAMLVVAVGVAGFFMQNQGLSQEEQDALAAFQKTKEAMQMLSKNFIEGSEELTYVSTFTTTKNKILK